MKLQSANIFTEANSAIFVRSSIGIRDFHDGILVFVLSTSNMHHVLGMTSAKICYNLDQYFSSFSSIVDSSDGHSYTPNCDIFSYCNSGQMIQ